MKAVKYGASWCGPCHIMRANLIQSGIPFEEIDIDERPDLAAAKHIEYIPVTEFYDDGGALIDSRTGIVSVEGILSIVNKH
ncbi:MAG: thioredoxin family protein [Bacteroidales bacterium]|nr:thioredoxin family protein [Bacteroidales bacterium]